MGTACAQSYANIFMVRFKEKDIYPLTKGRAEQYLRYIENIFFIWKGMEKEMENFFNKINKNHPSIKFDPKYSISDFEFIDVLVRKDEQKRLQTTVFKKKTNRQSYLHATSDHLATFKKSIPCSQILRFKRFIQQTANSSAIAKYCKSNLQKELVTHLCL